MRAIGRPADKRGPHRCVSLASSRCAKVFAIMSSNDDPEFQAADEAFSKVLDTIRQVSDTASPYMVEQERAELKLFQSVFDSGKARLPTFLASLPDDQS